MEMIKNLNVTELKESALILRAINHKLRQDIVQLLMENDMMTVTKIYVKLRVEQSVASQHLAVLRKANILTTKREGKFIHYSVNNEVLDKVAEIVTRLSSLAIKN